MQSEAFEPGSDAGSTLATLSEPTAAKRVTLAVIADPHVATRTEGTSKLFDRTETHLRNAIADIRARGIDAVLSVGDLTKDGEDRNYQAVDEIIDSLSVPFYAVPGNHDVPKAGDDHETMSVDEFAGRYSPTRSLPFSTSIGDVDIVGLNTAGTREYLHDTHDGGLNPSRREAIRDTVDAAESPVVLAHHNLPAMYDQLRAHRDAVERDMAIPPITRGGDEYAETLAEGGTSLLLTGHLHLPATAVQNGVREVMVPTTCSFPQAYLSITVGPEGTTVRFHPVVTREGLRHAFSVRSRHSATSRGLTAIASDRLASFPLVEEGHRLSKAPNGPDRHPVADPANQPVSQR